MTVVGGVPLGALSGPAWPQHGRSGSATAWAVIMGMVLCYDTLEAEAKLNFWDTADHADFFIGCFKVDS